MHIFYTQNTLHQLRRTLDCLSGHLVLITTHLDHASPQVLFLHHLPVKITSTSHLYRLILLPPLLIATTVLTARHRMLDAGRDAVGVRCGSAIRDGSRDHGIGIGFPVFLVEGEADEKEEGAAE